MTTLARLAGLLLALATAPAGAAVITVTSSADSSADDGSCSLREAIAAANADSASGVSGGECVAGSGADSIHFAIPGEGPHRILVATQLPVITTPVIIDGYTQAGATPNTLNALSGFNADLRIHLEGSQSAPVTRPGLQIEGPAASGSAVYGLEISGFTSPACCADNGIVVRNSIQNVVIAGNVIRNNRSRGIFVGSAGGSVSNLRIGGPEPEDRNAIYAHTSSAGISMSACVGCTIENNWIGVRNSAGTAAAAGNAEGIQISGGTRQTMIRDNWTAANSGAGIVLSSEISDNTVSNNLVGGAFANQMGIVIYNVNAAIPIRSRIEGNVVTGNQRVGVGIYHSQTGNLLQDHVLVGNRIYANGQVEIDLGSNGQVIPANSAVTPNDAGDADVGPNGQQNYPVLGTPAQSGSLLEVPYTLDSAADLYVLEFHFATQCDATGNGLQGSMPRDPLAIETMQLTGTAVLQPVGAPAAGFVVATATGSEGSSEFSACVPYAYSVSPTVFADSFE